KPRAPDGGGAAEPTPGDGRPEPLQWARARRSGAAPAGAPDPGRAARGRGAGRRDVGQRPDRVRRRALARPRAPAAGTPVAGFLGVLGRTELAGTRDPDPAVRAAGRRGAGAPPPEASLRIRQYEPQGVTGLGPRRPRQEDH